MEDEKIVVYVARLQTLVPSMKNCVENITDQVIVEKIMRTMTPFFNHVIIEIEESSDLTTLNI